MDMWPAGIGGGGKHTDGASCTPRPNSQSVERGGVVPPREVMVVSVQYRIKAQLPIPLSCERDVGGGKLRP